MCMVCDAERAGGIGGVMGGAETEISPYTKNVLLECAWFDPISIRRTSKALNLRTEASTRFERALDPEMAEAASRRCVELIQQIAGGEILAGLVDVYPARKEPQKIELTRKELLRVMGADVPDRDQEEILAALGFAPERSDHNRGVTGSLAATWQCTRPTWRHDVARETDIIEEVARHYGFDRFPPRLPAAKQPAARLAHAAAQDALRERLVALGYHEIVAIPLVDPERDAVFRAEGVTPAKMHNPLAEDASVLRSSGLINMVQALEWNINRGQQNVRLFEVGRKYELRSGKPVETPVLTLGATGLAREQSVHEPARKYSFADLKGELDALAELLGGFAWQPASTPWLHPARSARIAGFQPAGGTGAEPPQASAAEVGVAGQLSTRAAERFKLRQDVFVAELLLEPLYAAWERTRTARQYRPLPRFPAVERDFSLVLADGTTFAQVAEVIRSLGIEEVESVAAVDLFRGGQVPKGKFSLLVRVVFQSHAATLTEAQITDFQSRIVAAIEQKLGASLRAQ
jgi:phenylalanyl-tRNA synthetase beta chain